MSGMNTPRIMKERIRRVHVLFRELGYKSEGREDEQEEGIYSGSFKSADGFEGGFLIDTQCRFLEVAFTFQFTEELGMLIRDKLSEMLAICYDYGCYLSLEKPGEDMAFSVYSKIYYAGLNYYAMRETLYDFMDCVDTLAELLEPDVSGKQGIGQS
jgi:hypothetical protein